MPVEVYESALEQAKNDLTETTREFESVRIRKELMEKLFDALTQLTLHLNPVVETSAAPEASAQETPVIEAPKGAEEVAAHEVSLAEAPAETEEAGAHEAPASEAPNETGEAVHEIAANETHEGAEAAADETQALQQG
ncbi:MAG: hypothetical protein WA802_12805 [Terracidiphilus sp.]